MIEITPAPLSLNSLNVFERLQVKLKRQLHCWFGFTLTFLRISGHTQCPFGVRFFGELHEKDANTWPSRAVRALGLNMVVSSLMPSKGSTLKRREVKMPLQDTTRITTVLNCTIVAILHYISFSGAMFPG